MESCFLSLGSNIGDRKANLDWALTRLGAAGRINRVSSFYETKPWGKTDQPDFLNAAAELKTDLSPEGLLDVIKEIEKSAGRDFSAERWSPRPLDIDILLYGDLILSTPRLTIPHPRLSEREFVLAPLAEIAGDVVVPGTNQTCDEIRSARRAKCAVHGR